MNFRHEKPSHQYNVRRMVSESGWELCLDRVMYGCRVHLVDRTFPYNHTEYCAGSSDYWQNLIFNVVLKILSRLPEDFCFNGFWPKYYKRPMVNDPVCWANSCKMADIGDEERNFCFTFDLTNLDQTLNAEMCYLSLLDEEGLETYRKINLPVTEKR